MLGDSSISLHHTLAGDVDLDLKKRKIVLLNILLLHGALAITEMGLKE